eukprot:366275-Chlamydomonas_euryale.AAC.4
MHGVCGRRVDTWVGTQGRQMDACMGSVEDEWTRGSGHKEDRWTYAWGLWKTSGHVGRDTRKTDGRMDGWARSKNMSDLPWVPTGMNIGVSAVTCGSFMRLLRARP